MSAIVVAFAVPVQAAAGHQASGSSSAQATAAPQVSVTLVRDGVEQTHVTSAANVGAFLSEMGIATSVSDNLTPPADTPLTSGMRIEYRAAVPVDLYDGVDHRALMSAAPDVATLLANAGVTLGSHDDVQPQASEPIASGMVIRVTHQSVWTTLRHQTLKPKVVQRYDPRLPAGTTKTVSAGRSGEREVTVMFVQRGNEPLAAQTIGSRIVRKPKPRVIVHGIGEYAGFVKLAIKGFDATIGLARNALHMIATAYTAECAGCSGYTASGVHAGHGIVAVDPRVIPLGTRLFIPGYGSAVAGDTGGAIVGQRIDLGFNSLGDALRFGRRLITVYLLR